MNEVPGWERAVALGYTTPFEYYDERKEEREREYEESLILMKNKVRKQRQLRERRELFRIIRIILICYLLLLSLLIFL